MLLKHADQEKGNAFDAILANNSIDSLRGFALTKREQIRALPMKSSKRTPRADGYVGNLLKHILGESSK